jgi:oligopeptide transport system permease protein
MQIAQDKLQPILDWQEETGLQVLYPLVESNNFNPDPTDANNWYKAKKVGNPVATNASGQTIKLAYSEDMVLEDNYKRDADGNVKYWEYVGGGNAETAELKIRVLYYNYYQYLYGFLPNYLMGTESQGYDMALRIADGIRLSLLIAVCVCVINFVLGAAYGAVEGYYGGAVDLILERVSDILSGVPFIVVAALFQIHLAAKVGAIPSLLFSYVLTGWIGTAYRVRTQFYRFKNQEYVMAARTLGAKDSRVIWKHIFPNTLGTIITSSALAIPSTMMSESMLSYLGIVQLGGASGTSLGTLLADAESRWIQFPHLMLYPALIISLLMISFNLFGNGLRDAFNPSLRGVED